MKFNGVKVTWMNVTGVKVSGVKVTRVNVTGVEVIRVNVPRSVDLRFVFFPSPRIGLIHPSYSWFENLDLLIL